MQIGDLAKKANVNVQTIRYYERRGLLRKPPRKESGYRIYGPEDLHWLSFIRQAKSLGFSLDEIGAILRMRRKGECPCSEVTKIGERHLRDVRRQIEQLQRFYAELSRSLKRWKRLGTQNVPADAICILIERTMDNSRGAKQDGGRS